MVQFSAPSFNMMKLRRRRRLSLVSLVDIVLLWTLCVVQYTTMVSSSMEEIATTNDVTSEVGQRAKTTTSYFASPRRPLLDSIWKTFRQSLDSHEKSRKTSSTVSKSFVTPQEDRTTHFQKQREEMMNRRSLLFEKSISEHYMHHFIQPTACYWSDNDDIAQDHEDEGKELSKTLLRWKQHHPFKEDTQCYCFSESSDSYWSFQLCPRDEIFQGRRNKSSQMMQQTHSLGRYKEERGNKDEDHSATQALFQLATNKHPNALSIDMYQGGDRCEIRSNLRRLSAVIVHDWNSADRCPSQPTSADGIFMEDWTIESVEEVRTCQYVIHICKSSNHSPQFLNGENHSFDGSKWIIPDMSKSDTKEVNGTFLATLELIDFYRRKTKADSNLKLSADLLTSLHAGLPPMPQTKVHANRKLIKEMFIHAYDSYMYNGYPAPEVKPMTCQQATFDLVKIPGLTMIDSLDTLVVLGNYTEFARAVERLKHLNEHIAEDAGLFNGGGLFAINQNVSLFETNIRVLGGLLSAHQLAIAFLRGKVHEHDVRDENGNILIGENWRHGRCSNGHQRRRLDSEDNHKGINADYDDAIKFLAILEQEATDQCRNITTKFWEYDGFLLDLARDIGDRLLPAFETQTGIPFGTVNLMSGVPKGETTIASLAGGGTLSLEMELLGRLTGEERYGRAAKLSARALWLRRAPNDLLGKHICTRRGDWTESLSGIGSNSDSFYEYLIKHHLLFPEDADFWLQFVSAYGGVHKESRLGEWYADVDMSRGITFGGGSRRVFEALMAFYPGLQVLLGEIAPAARTLNSFFLVREHLGFLPERFNYGLWSVDTKGGTHLLRPEVLESAFFLHRANRGIQQKLKSNKPGFSVSRQESSSWQWAGDFALHAIEKLTRSKCGYASLEDVSPSTTGSLAAKKHLVKLYDEMPSYFLSETLKYLYLLFDDQNALNEDKDHDWMFTTEAHPIHYEKKRRFARDTRRMEATKISLKQRIRERLAGTHRTVVETLRGLQEEKWTSKSDYEGFLQQLAPLKLDARKMYIDSRARSVALFDKSGHWIRSVESLLPENALSGEFDRFNERENSKNAAVLSFRGLGSGSEITMSCPNLHETDFLWIRALNGGISDYSDIYVSRVQDDVTVPLHRSAFVGRADAVALHGAGIHIDSVYDSSSQCPVPFSSIHRGRHPNRQNEMLNQNRKHTSDNSAFFEMGDFGSFEVSAFPEGSGFFIKHIGSGETLMTTVFDGDTGSTQHSETLYLVYYRAGEESSSQRSVVMADTWGQSFSCSAHIMEMTSEDDEEPVCERDITEKSLRTIADAVVAQFPCAPALFGPTHMHNLQRLDTIEVEATLQAPVVGEEHGCSSQSAEKFMKDSESGKIKNVPDSENGVLSVVHRGLCTFQEKAMTQKQSYNAEGVIVVNSEDDLFVMSGNENATSNLIPVTVLISRSDGASLLELVDSLEDQKRSPARARISLVRDQVGITQSKARITISDNKFWPAVKASAEALQIFSESGWGVQATQLPKMTGEMEWQLLLMTHGN